MINKKRERIEHSLYFLYKLSLRGPLKTPVSLRRDAQLRGRGPADPEHLRAAALAIAGVSEDRQLLQSASEDTDRTLITYESAWPGPEASEQSQHRRVLCSCASRGSAQNH